MHVCNSGSRGLEGLGLTAWNGLSAAQLGSIDRLRYQPRSFRRLDVSQPMTDVGLRRPWQSGSLMPSAVI